MECVWLGTGGITRIFNSTPNSILNFQEWQLLFHYVLQYPMVIREAASLKKKGVGIHIEAALKKVCDIISGFVGGWGVGILTCISFPLPESNSDK